MCFTGTRPWPVTTMDTVTDGSEALKELCFEARDSGSLSTKAEVQMQHVSILHHHLHVCDKWCKCVVWNTTCAGKKRCRRP